MSIIKKILTATLGGDTSDESPRHVAVEVPEILAGKYRILSLLGQGSYGCVFLVEHIDLGARFALKLLNRSLSDDVKFAERFKREASALLTFTHPGSVQLRDFGQTEEQQYYMVTDFAEGIRLDQLLNQRGVLPPGVALAIVRELLAVLGAAHARGIVHRDVKPGNIIVCGEVDGVPDIRLLDFGIAKLQLAPPTSSARSTIEGFSIGTPEYMSPEQGSGESDVDHRSDLYAVGVVLYELLTGEVPFLGSTVIQTILKHLTQPPPPFAERLGVSSELEGVVFRALAKERGKRFSSAEEFFAACAAVQSKLAPVPVVTPSPIATGAVEEVEHQKILILDDSEMILNIAQHIFERDGFKVFTASTFSIIHDIIFAHGVRFMLCDVEMPGIPGPKVCQMLKEVVPTMTIVLFSNIDVRELERLATSCRADGFISKNTRPDEWLAAVKRFLPQS